MILCFALFLAGVVLCLLTGHQLVWALLLGLALFFLLGLRRGFLPRSLAAMAWAKGRESLIVVPVLLLIGTVTALWRSSGTIAFFLYYGLRGITPSSFILMAFLLSAALSFALGTSYGVTGTAGVVLITLARSGNVDLAITAGAIHHIYKSLRIFEGIGYGRSATAWQMGESEGGGYLLNDGLTHKGAAGEVGILGSIGRLTLSASAITIAGKQWQGSIGIGIKL